MSTFLEQIANLEVFTEYAVVVQAFNKIGQGPMSEEALVHTAEGAPTKPPEDVRLITLSSQKIKVQNGPVGHYEWQFNCCRL